MKDRKIQVKLQDANLGWKIFDCNIEDIIHIEHNPATLSLIDGAIKEELKDIIIDLEKNVHFICADEKEYLLNMDEMFPCIRIVEKE